MSKYWPVILAIVVGIGAGLGSAFVEELKPYAFLTGAISALVVAIVTLIKKIREEKETE